MAKTGDVIDKMVENGERLHERLETIIKRKVDFAEEKAITNRYLRYVLSQNKKLIDAKT